MTNIDVYALARKQSSWEGEIGLAAMPRLAAGLVRANGKLSYACRSGSDGHGRPQLRLELEAELALRCDRCARELAFALRVLRQFYFVDTEAELAQESIDESPEEALLGSTNFDLRTLIEDEAILQLPMSPRHERCAPSVSVSAAGAAAERPNPFSQLASLRGRLRGPK